MADLVNDKTVGYRITTDTMATKLSNGYWKVEQKVTQSKTFDGSTWDSRQVSMQATDKDLSKANELVTMSVLMYLEQVDGDLFVEQVMDDEELGSGEGKALLQ